MKIIRKKEFCQLIKEYILYIEHLNREKKEDIFNIYLKKKSKNYLESNIKNIENIYKIYRKKWKEKI